MRGRWRLTITVEAALPWINAGSTLVVAAATAVLAWREWERKRRSREEADARISSTAYALRRQLQSWWGNTWPGQDKKIRDKAEELVPHFNEAEKRIETLLILAPEASPEVSEAIREAAVRFYRGTRFINETVEAEWERFEMGGRGGEVSRELSREVKERFSRSWQLLKDSVEHLEDAIDDKLLDAAEELPE